MTPRRRTIVTRPDGALVNETAMASFLAGIERRAAQANAIAHPRRPALVRYGQVGC